MTPHFPIWSFGPKIESVDGICHQTDSMNRFYLDVKTGPNGDKGVKTLEIVTTQYTYVRKYHLNSYLLRENAVLVLIMSLVSNLLFEQTVFWPRA